MVWAEGWRTDPHRAGPIICDRCQYITKQKFSGWKSAKGMAGGVWFVGQKSYGATYCPECCVHLGLVDALNSFDINYTNSKHCTNESLMNEAWEEPHLLTLEFWNAPGGERAAELGAPAESSRPLATVRDIQGGAPLGQEELQPLPLPRRAAPRHQEEQRLEDRMPLLEQEVLQLKERVANLEATLDQLLARLGPRVGIGVGGATTAMP